VTAASHPAAPRAQHGAAEVQRGGTERAASAATVAARVFVADHVAGARLLGAALADQIDDPAAFIAAARTGLAAISDPAYLAGQRLVAPGIGPTLGVRTPLLDAVLAGLRRAVLDVRSSRLLVVADALARDEIRELRWMAIRVLGWILPRDPERSWQVLRRIGHDADDWITVDTLATAMAPGILHEPYRWAELEQLVFSPIRWERRLVGSAIATLPHVDHALGRTDVVTTRGLELVGQLIGDAEPDVQKALGWALRELAKVDPARVAAFCRAEAGRAVDTDDGHRAWVIRDALSRLPIADADAIRMMLAGVRRTPGAPSTSLAAATAAAFTSAGLGRPLPEVPLT
jgi:3-methyladenine DNA glycosylase AlkD